MAQNEIADLIDDIASQIEDENINSTLSILIDGVQIQITKVLGSKNMSMKGEEYQILYKETFAQLTRINAAISVSKNETNQKNTSNIVEHLPSRLRNRIDKTTPLDPVGDSNILRSLANDIRQIEW